MCIGNDVPLLIFRNLPQNVPMTAHKLDGNKKKLYILIPK